MGRTASRQLPAPSPRLPRLRPQTVSDFTSRGAAAERRGFPVTVRGTGCQPPRQKRPLVPQVPPAAGLAAAPTSTSPSPNVA